VPDSAPPHTLFKPRIFKPHAERFHPFGIPLAVEVNEPELLAAVADACRGCEDGVDPDARPLHLTLVVDRDLRGIGEPDVVVEGGFIRISGGGVEAWADALRGEGWCMISGDYLLDDAALRDRVLDPLILFLVTRSGRTPIHAAGFLAGDRAILLAGPSGAGKSCLALAAQEAGFDLLSDDTIYVKTGPALRLWGMSRPIHVFPKDAPIGGGAERLRGDKLKHAVPIHAGSARAVAEDAVLCVLASGERPSLRRIGRQEALYALGEPEAGFDLLRDEGRAALEALAARGAWLLTLSSEPAEAICLLAATFGRPRRRSS
jgi:hypothetical protein